MLWLLEKITVFNARTSVSTHCERRQQFRPGWQLGVRTNLIGLRRQRQACACHAYQIVPVYENAVLAWRSPTAFSGQFVFFGWSQMTERVGLLRERHHISNCTFAPYGTSRVRPEAEEEFWDYRWVEKYHIFSDAIDCLRQVIIPRKLQVTNRATDTILNFKYSTNATKMSLFSDLDSVYGTIVPAFARKATPWNRMLKKKVRNETWFGTGSLCSSERTRTNLL